jgi:hypothetical protein
VPGAWIGQTTPGGKILVPVDLAGRAGLLAVLTVYADGKTQGLETQFMWWSKNTSASPRQLRYEMQSNTPIPGNAALFDLADNRLAVVGASSAAEAGYERISASTAQTCSYSPPYLAEPVEALRSG